MASCPSRASIRHGFTGARLGAIGAGQRLDKAMKRAGIGESLVATVKSELNSGTSAFWLIAVSGDAEEISRALKLYRPNRLVRAGLSHATFENLKQALGSSDSSTSDRGRSPRATGMILARRAQIILPGIAFLASPSSARGSGSRCTRRPTPPVPCSPLDLGN